MTRVEKIRSLTDDELAALLYRLEGEPLTLSFCGDKPECNERLEQNEDIDSGECVQCMKEWLQSEVKGDELDD